VPEIETGWLREEQVVTSITTSLASLISRMRTRIDETDKPDLVTQDLLIGITQELEQAHWMWQAQAA
jgi:starvation-inducible DNA-binding protein